MKRVLFLLLVSVFMLPAFHSEAQVQGTQTPTHYQELTKQQQRQVKRDLRKKAREVANQQAFNAAVDALKDRNWVLMASTLYGPRGSAIPVSDNTLDSCIVLIGFFFWSIPTSSNLKAIPCMYS